MADDLPEEVTFSKLRLLNTRPHDCESAKHYGKGVDATWLIILLAAHPEHTVWEYWPACDECLKEMNRLT